MPGVNHHVQGNCTGGADLLQNLRAAAPQPLLPLKPAQCLLVFSSNTFSVSDGRLWMDNLYFAAAPARPSLDTMAVSVGLAAGGHMEGYSSYRKRNALELYLTNITYHGDGASPGRAFGFDPIVRGTSVLFQGAAPLLPRHTHELPCNRGRARQSRRDRYSYV